ncbi:MAG: hypothetical protein Q9205_007112 [Flavoplaca limonia]
MEPWALVAVSPQFRTEIRAIIYPPTPIDLYPLGTVGKVACRTWIEGLQEEMLLRHICIEDFLDIHWLRDGAVHERPDERRIRLRYEYIKGIRKQCKTADDLNEWPFDEPEYDEFNETMGEWELRWQQHVEGEWTNCQDVVSDALLDMGLQTAEPTTAALTGFGKNGIRTLVEAYVTTYRPKGLSHFCHEDFNAIELGLKRYERLLEEK